MGVPETQEQEEVVPDTPFASDIHKESSFNTDTEDIPLHEVQEIMDSVQVNNESASPSPLQFVPHPPQVPTPRTLKVDPVIKTPAVADKYQVPNALHTPQREPKAVMSPPQITVKGQRKPAPTRIRLAEAETAADLSAPRRRRVTRQLAQDAQLTKLPTPAQLPRRNTKRRANFVEEDDDEPQLPALEPPIYHAPVKKLRTYKKGSKK